MSPIIKQFCDYYQELSIDGLSQLNSIYSKNITFVDPIHEINGLANVHDYFAKMLANLNSCRFEIKDIVEAEQQAFITWEMQFSHPKLKSGNSISVLGNSHLKYKNLIHFHQDYYDMGEMLYEHIPVLGFVINKLKSGLSRWNKY